MIDPVTMNAANPKDDENGNLMLERMNVHHAPLYAWGHGHITIEKAKAVLDIGCGGGQNILNMAAMAPAARLYGADISEASLNMTGKVCKSLSDAGRLTLIKSDAGKISLPDGSLDAATAFETTYYWDDIGAAFRNVWRMLSPGGVFLVCNEDGSLKGNEEIGAALSMRFYSADDLSALMRGAGFSGVTGFSHENGRWVCAAGIK